MHGNGDDRSEEESSPESGLSSFPQSENKLDFDFGLLSVAFYCAFTV
jgi:hypothetical protein